MATLSCIYTIVDLAKGNDWCPTWLKTINLSIGLLGCFAQFGLLVSGIIFFTDLDFFELYAADYENDPRVNSSTLYAMVNASMATYGFLLIIELVLGAFTQIKLQPRFHLFAFFLDWIQFVTICNVLAPIALQTAFRAITYFSLNYSLGQSTTPFPEGLSVEEFRELKQNMKPMFDPTGSYLFMIFVTAYSWYFFFSLILWCYKGYFLIQDKNCPCRLYILHGLYTASYLSMILFLSAILPQVYYDDLHRGSQSALLVSVAGLGSSLIICSVVFTVWMNMGGGKNWNKSRYLRCLEGCCWIVTILVPAVGIAIALFLFIMQVLRKSKSTIKCRRCGKKVHPNSDMCLCGARNHEKQ